MKTNHSSKRSPRRLIALVALAVGLLMAGATLPPEALNPELAASPRETQGTGWLGRLTGGLFR